MHPREGKDKWFSAAPVVPGVRGRYLPEAALICNFPGGDANDPGLMQYNDVVTFFHEFGHLMHAILGGHTEWAGLSGFATEGDFIEVPSQMLEEFFRDEKLLQSFAKHYQTGEILPSELIRKMKPPAPLAAPTGCARSSTTPRSRSTCTIRTPQPSTSTLTQLSTTPSQPWTWLDGNRMYASFGHLTGYSSNYYTYAFDKVIALDFFAQFDADDLLDGDAGRRYRKLVLDQGGSTGPPDGARLPRTRRRFSAFTHGSTRSSTKNFCARKAHDRRRLPPPGPQPRGR